MREGGHEGTDERRDEVGEEGRMRVEEGADDDGDDGKGQDVDVHQIVAHAKLREEAGHEDAGEDEESVRGAGFAW